MRIPPCTMAAAAAPRTRAPAPAPDSAARRRPLGDPTARWAARFRAAPASAPPDGDDGAPGWGRLRPAYGGVDHRPCSRPPWLSMTGIVRGRGEGGATPGVGGGCGGGGRAGGGRRRDAACVLVAVRRFLRRGRGNYIGNNRRRTNDNQKLTKGGFRRGGLNFAPLTTPPKKKHLPLGLGGGGGSIPPNIELPIKIIAINCQLKLIAGLEKRQLIAVSPTII